MGSILHLHEVPETGGDTLFANMYAAYEALSDPMKQLLEGLSAVNASAHHFGGYFGYRGHVMSGNPFPESVHPVVRTHPETGRKALYVNEDFHHPHRRTASGGEQGGARAAVPAPRRTAIPVPGALEARHHRDVGQPLHPAPRDVGLLPADALRTPLHHRGRPPALSAS